MAKKKKLTKDELEKVKNAVGTVRNITARIGDLEIAKSKMIIEYDKAQAQLAEEQKVLEDNYGIVSINLEDGVITEAEEATE